MSRRLPPGRPDPPSRRRAAAAAPAGPFGVLDIGTTKIVCLIGRIESDGTLRVLGFGWQKGARRARRRHRRPRGSRAARSAPRSARPRRWPDTRLRGVIVNLSCGQPESPPASTSQWPIGGRAVTEADLRRVLNEGRRRGAEPTGARSSTSFRSASPSTTRRASDDPRGMFCDTLERAAARDRRGAAVAAQPRRLPRALRPRDRRAGRPRPMAAAWRRWSRTRSSSAPPSSTWAAAPPASPSSPRATCCTPRSSRSAAGT